MLPSVWSHHIYPLRPSSHVTSSAGPLPCLLPSPLPECSFFILCSQSILFVPLGCNPLRLQPVVCVSCQPRGGLLPGRKGGWCLVHLTSWSPGNGVRRGSVQIYGVEWNDVSTSSFNIRVLRFHCIKWKRNLKTRLSRKSFLKTLVFYVLIFKGKDSPHTTVAMTIVVICLLPTSK